jgi:hypothetical protein
MSILYTCSEINHLPIPVSVFSNICKYLGAYDATTRVFAPAAGSFCFTHLVVFTKAIIIFDVTSARVILIMLFRVLLFSQGTQNGCNGSVFTGTSCYSKFNGKSNLKSFSARSCRGKNLATHLLGKQSSGENFHLLNRNYCGDNLASVSDVLILPIFLLRKLTTPSNRVHTDLIFAVDQSLRQILVQPGRCCCLYSKTG